MKYKIAVFAMTLLGCTNGHADDQYLQLSSAVDQNDTIFKAEIIDAQNGIDYDAATGQATMTKTGAYEILYTPQTGNVGGCGHYWLAVNGVDLGNSNIEVCLPPNMTAASPVNAIVNLKKGDTLGFRMSGDLGADATQPDGEPLIPSAIISVKKL